jgi:urease accessory protein
VTCFRSASYNQIQTFDVAQDGSFVILDWLTSGRKALDEDWAFTRYYSENEVVIGGRRWARDVMLLEGDVEDDATSQRKLAMRLAPYSCYAMVLLYGHKVEKIIENLRVTFEMITVFKRKEPEDLMWSFSPAGSADPTGPGRGAIVRIAGKETDGVKMWLKEELKGLEEIVGLDIYRKAFR